MNAWVKLLKLMLIRLKSELIPFIVKHLEVVVEILDIEKHKGIMLLAKTSIIQRVFLL